MTKAEELAILQDAIAKLGPDSYLGPWLRDSLPWLHDQLRCDLAPESAAALHDQAVKAAAETTRSLIGAAEFKALNMVLRAEQEAARIRAEAAEAAQQTQRAAQAFRAAVRAAERAMDGFAWQ